jgi:hypothetical protein
VSEDVLKEELEDGSSAIVVVGPDACHKTGVSVNKGVDDDVPST